MLYRKILAALALVTLIANAGCENIALIGRPSLELEGDELAGEVTGLDARSREIHLQPTQGPKRVIWYDDNTRVIYRGREYPVSRVDVGDIVALPVGKKDWRDRVYAGLISVQEGARDRREAMIRPGTGIERLEGSVEYVDRERGTFEIRDRSGSRIVVSVPRNAPRWDSDRVRRLRGGDFIRMEGRFINTDRFELEAFV